MSNNDKRISRTADSKKAVRVISKNPYRLHSPNTFKTASGRVLHRTGSAINNMGSSSGGGAQSVAQAPLYYDYRWSTPDKYYFPKNRVVANAIWREIYKRDAVVAVCTDMYAEMPWSDFDLIGIEDKNVRKIYEDMFNSLQLVSKMPMYTKSFLTLGECVLHSIFDSKKGFWVKAIAHNPDYINVIGTGLSTAEPLLYLRPTPEIKKLITATDPRVRKLQKLIPSEIISAFKMNREIPLDPLNTTYIARMNDANDVRGTSIYSRLYRTIMYEDFIVNASLAIAQRHAAPMRLFKMGDPNGEWMPTDADIEAFQELLSLAEADPLAAIVTHHNVTCELVGVSDRVLLISREWDFIERIKLMALGVAKSFLVGETSFAASIAGLQVLMERLNNLRTRFEQDWIYSKLCLPVAEINEFYKRPESELAHRVRIKKKEDLEPIMPTLKWKKELTPTQDQGLLSVWRDLKDRGLISDRTYAAGAGVDIDVERDNTKEEVEFKKKNPELFPQPQQEGGAGGLGGGGGMPGGMPPSPGGEEGGIPGGEEGGPESFESPPEQSPEPVTLPGGSTKEEFLDRLEDLKDMEDKVAMPEIIAALEKTDIDRDILKELNRAAKRFPKGPSGSDLLSGK